MTYTEDEQQLNRCDALDDLDSHDIISDGDDLLDKLLVEWQAAPAMGDMLRTYAKFGVCSCFPCAAWAALIRLGVFDEGTRDRARELVDLLDEIEVVHP